MCKPIPIGKTNFEKLIDENCYYVDKTMVIEDLLKDGSDVILFPRPRRFGKSLLISMLENFFDKDKDQIGKDLFKNLYISKSELYPNNLNKYPVIRLDFKDLKASTFNSNMYDFRSMMSEAYAKKECILDDLRNDEKDYFNLVLTKQASFEDYQSSLVNLSKWCERHYKEKVIILIDEYDTPINAGHNEGYYEDIIRLIEPLFSKAFKGNDSLKKGILTGILRPSRGESLFAFSYPKVYDEFSRNYNEYFGFTEEETKILLESYDLELTDDVKDFYDGYNFNGTHIFNPWSILNYAKDKTIASYWVNTGSNRLIKKMLESISPENKIKIDNLILGNSITFEYQPKLSYKDLKSSNDFNSILNLLLVSGYLTFDREVDDLKYYKIPNNEVRNDLANILQLVVFDGNINYMDETLAFRDALLTHDKNKAEVNLNKLLQTVSYYDNKEVGYHQYLLCLFTYFLNSKNFIVSSNEESGYGRPDMLIRRKDRTKGLVIEFKVSDSLDDKDMEIRAKEGLDQLKEKNYKQRLEFEGYDEIYEYVFVFHGKKVIIR